MIINNIKLLITNLLFIILWMVNITVEKKIFKKGWNTLHNFWKYEQTSYYASNTCWLCKWLQKKKKTGHHTKNGSMCSSYTPHNFCKICQLRLTKFCRLWQNSGQRVVSFLSNPHHLVDDSVKRFNIYIFFSCLWILTTLYLLCFFHFSFSVITTVCTVTSPSADIIA